MGNAIIVVSGGLDSVTLAYVMAHQGYGLHLLSFNYGQRHLKELAFAKLAAKDLGAQWDCVDLTSLQPLFGASSLTDVTVAVPEGHYAADVMKHTIVPNRNAIFLSVAFAVAVAENVPTVALAVHGGDHTIYPDCRPEFLTSFNQSMHLANAWSDPPPSIYAPFVDLNKSDIVKQGASIGVPFERTWSCYVGNDVHCGRCGTDVERKEAFALAHVPDPTSYLDPDFGMD